MIYTNIYSLKQLRQHYNITQLEVSNLIGISCRSYRDKEKGVIPFSQIEIIKLIKLFELEENDCYQLFYKDYLNNYKKLIMLSINDYKKVKI